MYKIPGDFLATYAAYKGEALYYTLIFKPHII